MNIDAEQKLAEQCALISRYAFAGRNILAPGATAKITRTDDLDGCKVTLTVTVTRHMED